MTLSRIKQANKIYRRRKKREALAKKHLNHERRLQKQQKQTRSIRRGFMDYHENS